MLPHKITREEVQAEARTWLGTPFSDQGSIKGKRADCIGFPWGVARKLRLAPNIGLDSPSVKPYMGYGRHPVPSKFIGALRKHLVEIKTADLQVSDIILFRGKLEPSHLALVTDYGIIHSSLEFGKVVEHRLTDNLRSRILLAFRFPIFVDM